MIFDAEFFKQLVPYSRKVLDFFSGDSGKAVVWWHAPNPSLGNVSPHEMICTGHKEKVWKFIDESLGENQ